MMNLQKKSYKPIIKNGDYLFRDNFTFEFPVEIHFSRMAEFDNSDALKVLVLSSESMMSPNRSTIHDVINNHTRYNLILSADDEINTFCDNAQLFPYGSTWLNRGKIDHPDGLGCYEPGPIFEREHKNFDVSFLASWYDIDRPGYRLRQEIWNRKDEIEIPTTFYTSTKCFSESPNPLPAGEKDSLFDSQYHICIENQAMGHYFSEKVIDAFLTETIPVYWGCTNIEDYFDVDGMILFQTFDELKDKLNEITPSYYESILNIVHKNKHLALEFANFDERIFNIIKDYR
jgi:hypothetical protein